MKNKLCKIIIGLIIIAISGFLPYFIYIFNVGNNTKFDDLIMKLSIIEYANDTIKEYKQMANTDEALEYVSSKEFKKELINNIDMEFSIGSNYSVAYGVMDGLIKVFIKIGIICSIITLIIYLKILKALSVTRDVQNNQG